MVMVGNAQAKFAVRAVHEPNTLSRILEFFALNDITPATLQATKIGDGMQNIEVTCSDVDSHRAEIIANKIRQMVTVRTARLEVTYLQQVA
jgi:hypothetical protein